MADSQESLREALLDLERARLAERKVRVQNEQLLRGLELLEATDSNEAMFEKVLALFRELLEFDQAFILRREEGEELRTVASTSPAFDELRWAPGEMTERVLDGNPVATFDISLLPEWRGLLEGLEPTVSSALHIGLHTEPRRAMIVCTHAEAGFFSPEHVEVGRRFGMIVTQALVNRDLRELKLEAFQRSMRDRFFQRSNDLLGIVDASGRLQEINPAFEQRLGYQGRQLRGRSLLELVAEADRTWVKSYFERLNRQSVAVTFEARFRTRGRGVCWLQWNMPPPGDDGLIFAVGRDITELKSTQEELEELNVRLEEKVRERTRRLEELARTDELTGLHNRRYLRDRLADEVARTARYDNDLSIIYLDLDGFSRLNNEYGHLVGDEALRRVGEVLREETRETDVPARLGGDEFVVILPETSSREAEHLARRLTSAFDAIEVEVSDDASVEVAASIGIAEWVEDVDTVDRFLSRADEAMYRVKGESRTIAISERGDGVDEKEQCRYHSGDL